MSEHTKEPWNCDGPSIYHLIADGVRTPIAFVYSPACAEHGEIGRRSLADARRIVACVNFLAGITTEELVSGRYKACLLDTVPIVPEPLPVDPSWLEEEANP